MELLYWNYRTGDLVLEFVCWNLRVVVIVLELFYLCPMRNNSNMVTARVTIAS